MDSFEGCAQSRAPLQEGYPCWRYQCGKVERIPRGKHMTLFIMLHTEKVVSQKYRAKLNWYMCHAD